MGHNAIFSCRSMLPVHELLVPALVYRSAGEMASSPAPPISITVLFETHVIAVDAEKTASNAKVVKLAREDLSKREIPVLGAYDIFCISREDAKILKSNPAHVPTPKEPLDELDPVDENLFLNTSRVLLLQRTSCEYQVRSYPSICDIGCGF